MYESLRRRLLLEAKVGSCFIDHQNWIDKVYASVLIMTANLKLSFRHINSGNYNSLIIKFQNLSHIYNTACHTRFFWKILFMISWMGKITMLMNFLNAFDSSSVNWTIWFGIKCSVDQLHLWSMCVYGYGLCLSLDKTTLHNLKL